VSGGWDRIPWAGLPRRRRSVGIAAALAVVLVVATIGIVTAVQGDLFWLRGSTTNPCGTPSTGQTPLDSFIAFSDPREAVDGPNHWYNFTVESAGGGIVLGGLTFAVAGPTGANITPTAMWSSGVVGLTGTWVGIYDFGTATWMSGQNVLLASSQTLILDTGVTSLSDAGNVLNIALQTACLDGSVQAAIP
jgi:hypothetical protein